MKRYAFLLLPALLINAPVQAADHTAQHQAQRHPLRPTTQCPNINRINEWHVIDAHTLTVRDGPRRYVMKTRFACPKLGRYGPGIRFHPSNDKRALEIPRICGDLGDQVSSRAQPPCEVQSVREISKQRFDALNRKAVRNGSGAEMPTRISPRH